MCQPASFIVTKYQVFWSKLNESHESIIEENKLDDTKKQPDFIRVEIIPKNQNHLLPLSQWQYRLDQDIAPAWYAAKEVEKRARAELPAWFTFHVKTSGHHVITKGWVFLHDSSSAELCGSSSAKLYGSSSAKLHSSSSAKLHDSSSAVLYGSSSAVLYDSSSAVLSGSSSAVLYRCNKITVFDQGAIIDRRQGTPTLIVRQ